MIFLDTYSKNISICIASSDMLYFSIHILEIVKYRFQVDFGSIKYLTEIATKGRFFWTRDSYITTYYITYSRDGEQFEYVMDGVVNRLFSGNYDGVSIVSHSFNPGFVARYVRLVAQGSYNSISLRWEIYGCTGTHN